MRRMIFAVLGILVLAASSARAHHGYANFFLDQRVSIEGDIEAVRFANPHIVLTIRAADGTVYTATWRAAYQMELAGVTRTTLRVWRSRDRHWSTATRSRVARTDAGARNTPAA